MKYSMDFRLSQGSVATYRRWGGSLCVYTENFLANQLLSNIKWLPFLVRSVESF